MKTSIYAMIAALFAATAASADDLHGGLIGGGMSSAFTTGGLTGNGSVEALAGNIVSQTIGVRIVEREGRHIDRMKLDIDASNITEGLASLRERGNGQGFAGFAGGSKTVWGFAGDFDADF